MSPLLQCLTKNTGRLLYLWCYTAHLEEKSAQRVGHLLVFSRFSGCCLQNVVDLKACPPVRRTTRGRVRVKYLDCGVRISGVSHCSNDDLVRRGVPCK